MHLSYSGALIHLQACTHTHTNRESTSWWQADTGTELWDAICVQTRCVLSCRLSNYSHGQGDNTAGSLWFHSSGVSTYKLGKLRPNTPVSVRVELQRTPRHCRAYQGQRTNKPKPHCLPFEVLFPSNMFTNTRLQRTM